MPTVSLEFTLFTNTAGVAQGMGRARKDYRHDHKIFQEIGGKGLPLGILKEQTFEEVEVDIKNSTLYCYSDGVTEAMTPTGGMLGEEGLRSLLLEYHQISAATRLESLINRIRVVDGHLHDDITMLLVEACCNGPSSVAQSGQFSPDPQS